LPDGYTEPTYITLTFLKSGAIVNMNRAIHSAKIFGIPLIAVFTAGCATVVPSQEIKAGDEVGVHFTCRQKTGEIAASTYSDINNSSLPKSALFLKRSVGDPVVIQAGSELLPASAAKRKSFEEEIMDRLAGTLVGMREGDRKSVEITGDRLANLPQEEQFVKIRRIWSQPKEVRMLLSEYKARTKMEPAVGQQYAVYPAIPGKVASISGDEVLIRFAPAAQEVEVAFGKGKIIEKEDHYDIEINAVKGTLVRTSNLVGRIADADEEFITLDYGQPLAGEALRCDVLTESVKPGEKGTAASSDKAVTQDLNGAPAKAAVENTSFSEFGSVEQGDLVKVNYTATLNDGTVFATTRESVAKDPQRKKVSWFKAPGRYEAGVLVAGKEELLPGLGEAVLGLGAGAKKELRLTADKAFGQPDPEKKIKFPCVRTLPLIIRMPKVVYVKQLSSDPVLNSEVDLIPYFKTKVTEVTKGDVALQFLARDGQIVTEEYGTVKVSVKGDQVTTTLVPTIGAEFPLQDQTGIITATDGVNFTVDANHPLAGKDIVIDFEVVSLSKAKDAKTSTMN